MEMTKVSQSNMLFIGIDCHPTEYTAMAINRFEEEQGMLRFENTLAGIQECLVWLKNLSAKKETVLIGLEGGGNNRHGLLAQLVKTYEYIYEVNPLFTKQRRLLGTKPGKSDPIDAKVIAEVVIKKQRQLPKITKKDVSGLRLCLRKTVWYYEDLAVQGATIKTTLKELERELSLAQTGLERKILNLILHHKEAELEKIQKIQKQLQKTLTKLLQPQGSNLTTMKGIQTVLAAKIVAHTNGIERFRTVWKYIRYAGIAPVEKSSGKTKRHKRDTRGNRQLNASFYMIALNQIRWNEKAKQYFQKKVAEGKTKKHALRCLMRRVASVVYGMLKSGEPYRG